MPHLYIHFSAERNEPFPALETLPTIEVPEPTTVEAYQLALREYLGSGKGLSFSRLLRLSRPCWESKLRPINGRSPVRRRSEGKRRMSRYSLRTLMIVLALGPPVLAGLLYLALAVWAGLTAC